MPPPKSSKPGQGLPSKKTEQKKKERVIEDKTFGIKNKKGAKQQKFIQQVQKQVQSGGIHQRKVDDPNIPKKKAEDDPLDFNAIFKPVVEGQKVEKGVDPKSILCAFFKSGKCLKGDKCKFSHDLEIERKSEKRSLYCDIREEQQADTMDLWDEQKLKDVVEKKHASEKTKAATDIICKFFLDAVEKSKYGWFWECPNGKDCHYKHALPPGFVLKKDKIKDDKKDELSIEDLIEKERAALGSSNVTRVTLVSFIAWKKRKIIERRVAMKAEEEKKRADFKAGKGHGLSGREMFTFNPEMAAEAEFEDGDEAYDTRNLNNEDDEDTNEYKEINFDDLDYEEEVDGSGTQATADRLSKLNLEPGTSIPIDENLFQEDDEISDSESDSNPSNSSDDDDDSKD